MASDAEDGIMAQAPAITAVIYDMDGTLVDSERISQLTWEQTAEQMGAEIPQSLYRSFLGRNIASVTEMLVARLGAEELAQEALRVHAELFDKMCVTELELKPGARESIAGLREAGLAVGLATSTHRQRALPRLERFGLQDAFDSITCGNEVSHSKPEPDIFLLAAERMGADPSTCAVVEDSTNGVLAGHAAGMRVFMVPDIVQPSDEIAALCIAVLPSLHELTAAVTERS